MSQEETTRKKESEDRAHYGKVIVSARRARDLGQGQSTCSVSVSTATLKNKFSDVRLREKPVFAGN